MLLESGSWQAYGHFDWRVWCAVGKRLFQGFLRRDGGFHPLAVRVCAEDQWQSAICCDYRLSSYLEVFRRKTFRDYFHRAESSENHFSIGLAVWWAFRIHRDRSAADDGILRCGEPFSDYERMVWRIYIWQYGSLQSLQRDQLYRAMEERPGSQMFISKSLQYQLQSYFK